MRKGSLRNLKRASLTVEAALVLPVLLSCLVTTISFMDIYKIETEHLEKLCQEAMLEGSEAYKSGVTGDIVLEDDYSFSPLRLIFYIPEAQLSSQVTVRPWTGEDGSIHDVSGGASPERMVYRTASGHVIHLDPHCSYLDIHIRAVSGADLSASYTACERCSRGQQPGAIVYVTGGGDHFHNLGTCSALRRTVMLIPESEAGDMSLCSRCGGG